MELTIAETLRVLPVSSDSAGYRRCSSVATVR
jgi:hypothetical protein